MYLIANYIVQHSLVPRPFPDLSMLHAAREEGPGMRCHARDLGDRTMVEPTWACQDETNSLPTSTLPGPQGTLCVAWF